MENIVVSIGKNKSIENENLYKENYSFLEKITNYEMKKLEEIERVYNRVELNYNISSLIKKEKNNIYFPIMTILCSVLSFSSVIATHYTFLIFVTIFFTAASIALIKSYFGQENKKINIYFRVYEKIEKTDFLSMEELSSLQKLIDKEDMLELLRKYDTNVTFKNAIFAVRHHFLPFKDFKAQQQYDYIKEQNNKK